MTKGTLFIVSAPSGAGKSTMCSKVMELLPDVSFSVSHTTRPPRSGEEDGKDYHFVTVERFMQMVEQEQFVEWAEVHGNFYGTSWESIRSELEKGMDVILDIDVQGAAQVKKVFPEAVSIFILTPSLEELERRLRNRNTDSEDVIRRRLDNAVSEIRQIGLYDYSIINDDLDRAVNELAAIFIASRCRTERIVQQLPWIESIKR